MRKALLPLALAGALPLGGCVYAGLAPALVEAVNETAGQRRYTAEEFGPAAAEACRGRAARHGRVEISRVEPNDGSSMRVYGTIEDAYGGPARTFSCVFDRGGNIASFRRSRKAG